MACVRRPYRTARAMPLTDAQKLLNARLSYGGAEISMKVIAEALTKLEADE